MQKYNNSSENLEGINEVSGYLMYYSFHETYKFHPYVLTSSGAFVGFDVTEWYIPLVDIESISAGTIPLPYTAPRRCKVPVLSLY